MLKHYAELHNSAAHQIIKLSDLWGCMQDDLYL